MEAEFQGPSEVELLGEEPAPSVDVEYDEVRTEETGLDLGDLIVALQSVQATAGNASKVYLGTGKHGGMWQPVRVSLEGHETHHCHKCDVDHFSPYVVQVVMK